jgi:hypothetical protein
MDGISPLVARGALQVPDTGLGRVAISRHFFSNQAGRSHAVDLRSEAKHLERPNGVPVHVYLVPLRPVTGGSGVRMMIVVPSFTKGQ